MKTKITMIILMLSLAFVSKAQTVASDAYFSSKHLTGLSLYKVTKSGIVYGVSGSYYFATYTGETNHQYTEVANALSPINPADWPSYYKNTYYKSFTEDRGTVKGLLGFSAGNTIITAQVGLSFRTTYYLGKDGGRPIPFTDPVHNYFYTYENISPRALAGINVTQIISGRIGLNLGYNNVENLTFGVSYKITPTGIMKW